MNEFFAELGGDLSAAASRRGVSMEAPTLDPDEAEELLELARVTAHTRERRFAPLSCFLAGIAIERLRTGLPTLSGAERAAYLREVRQTLESRSAPE